MLRPRVVTIARFFFSISHHQLVSISSPIASASMTHGAPKKAPPFALNPNSLSVAECSLSCIPIYSPLQGLDVEYAVENVWKVCLSQLLLVMSGT